MKKFSTKYFSQLLTMSAFHGAKTIKGATMLNTLVLILSTKIVLCLTPEVIDLATPMKEFNEFCGYESCPIPLSDDGINVHIVPHTHYELAFQRTFAEHYAGHDGLSIKSQVNMRQTLDGIILELYNNNKRRFTLSDFPYFFHWWSQRDNSIRQIVYQLIRTGRLSFVGGGWGMNDEATTNYHAIIDSFTYTLRKINSTFLECGRPLVAWQSDVMGHSREFASLAAQMGFDALFINPISFDDELARMRRWALEMLWRGSDDLGAQSDIFTHKLFDGYWAPPGFCFSSLCKDPLIVSSDKLYNNEKERAQEFINMIYYRQAPNYNSSHVMVVMGQLLGYFDAPNWFANIDALIRAVNTMAVKEPKKIYLMYSTPACYAKAVRDQKVPLETKQDDFLPMAYDKESYLTGFYTSLPSVKLMAREVMVYLTMCKQMRVLAELGAEYNSLFEELHWIMGVFQDHTVITGALMNYIKNYYSEKMYIAMQRSTLLLKEAWNKLRKSPTHTIYYRCSFNISRCHLLIGDDYFVILYNSLAWPVTVPVRMPLQCFGGGFKVYDPKGDLVKSAIMRIPQPIGNIDYRANASNCEVVFMANNIPPIGYKSYFIQRTTSMYTSKERNKRSKREHYREREKRTLIKNIGKHNKKFLIRQTNPLFEDTTLLYDLDYEDDDKTTINPAQSNNSTVLIETDDETEDDTQPPRDYEDKDGKNVQTNDSVEEETAVTIKTDVPTNKTKIKSKGYKVFLKNLVSRKKMNKMGEVVRLRPAILQDNEATTEKYVNKESKDDSNESQEKDGLRDIAMLLLDQGIKGTSTSVEAHPHQLKETSTSVEGYQHQLIETSTSVEAQDMVDKPENNDNTAAEVINDQLPPPNDDKDEPDDSLYKTPNETNEINTNSVEATTLNDLKVISVTVINSPSDTNTEIYSLDNDTYIDTADEPNFNESTEIPNQRRKYERLEHSTDTPNDNTYPSKNHETPKPIEDTKDNIEKTSTENVIPDIKVKINISTVDVSSDAQNELEDATSQRIIVKKPFNILRNELKYEDPYRRKTIKKPLVVISADTTMKPKNVGSQTTEPAEIHTLVGDVDEVTEIQESVNINQKIIIKPTATTSRRPHIEQTDETTKKPFINLSTPKDDNQKTTTKNPTSTEHYTERTESNKSSIDFQTDTPTNQETFGKNIVTSTDASNDNADQGTTNNPTVDIKIDVPINRAEESTTRKTIPTKLTSTEIPNVGAGSPHQWAKVETPVEQKTDSEPDIDAVRILKNSFSSTTDPNIEMTSQSDSEDDVTVKPSNVEELEKFRNQVLYEMSQYKFDDESENTSFIENKYIKVHIDQRTKKISGVTLSNGVYVALDIQFYYYPSDDPRALGNMERKQPGAYLFRAIENKPIPIMDFIDTRVYKTSVVEEAHVMYADWASFVIRVYEERPVIEVEWLVGPVPIGDHLGKEVFIRYLTDLIHDGVFYTDSNGRQTIKRIRNMRPTFESLNLDYVAGNYYPVTSKIAIEDLNSEIRFAVFNDRAQGGTSLADGEIDLMVTRRILTDDTGVFTTVNDTEFGKGVITRGKHYIYISKTNHKPYRIFEKKFAKEIQLGPTLLASRPDPYGQDSKNIWFNSKNEMSFLNNKMPIGIHILTLESWNSDTILIRLENYLEKSDSRQNNPKLVNLRGLFKNIYINKVRETTLAGNMWLDEYRPKNWTKQENFVRSFNDFYGTEIDVEFTTDEKPTTFEDVNLNVGVLLNAQQIRTFVCWFDYVDINDK